MSAATVMARPIADAPTNSIAVSKLCDRTIRVSPTLLTVLTIQWKLTLALALTLSPR